jgi:predicted ArsR family transcriptional regulator
LREDVLAFGQPADMPVRPQTVAAALGANNTAVSRAIAELHSEGLLAVVDVPGGDGRGRWCRAAPTVAQSV